MFKVCFVLKLFNKLVLAKQGKSSSLAKGYGQLTGEEERGSLPLATEDEGKCAPESIQIQKYLTY